MMNPVLLLVRNNRAITEEAIQSVLNQTILVNLLVINNGSTDGVQYYLNDLVATDERVSVIHHYPGKGVAESWNVGLRRLFTAGCEYALVVNNDIQLRPDTYELLLAADGPFVTCVGVRGRDYGERKGTLHVIRNDDGKIVFPGVLTPSSKLRQRYGQLLASKSRPHPDFSCYLIRRSVWETVGEFDEGFKGGYAEDWDMHVRLHKAGVTAGCIDVPFLHHGALTIATADPDEQARIRKQADENRLYFERKWGVKGGSPEYYSIFGQTGPESSGV